MESSSHLLEYIGTPAMLEQTAEECSELAQACLKLARKYRGENPTPKTMEDVLDNFHEEIADVLICLYELSDGDFYSETIVETWLNKKKERMKKRLSEIDNERKCEII